MWKSAFSKDLHKKAKTHLESLTDDIKQIRLKIEKPVKDIDSLGSVMFALEEIRKKESEIELQFRPVTEMYSLLETYLPEVMEKEESDVSSIIDKDWAKLVIDAEAVRN
jgi:dynein heavy chain